MAEDNVQQVAWRVFGSSEQMHLHDDHFKQATSTEVWAEFEKQEQKLLQVGNQFRICLNKEQSSHLAWIAWDL